MKKIIPSYIIAIVTGFMLFIYEPIILYATNYNDFWFDIYLIIKPNLLMFLLFVFVLCIFYTIIYLINLYFSNKLYVYKIIVILSLAIFIALYIQGNFLIGSLPALDGTAIDWEKFSTEKILSILAWIVPLIVFLIFTLKYKYDKTIKIYTFIVATIFVMLCTSMISVLAKPGVLKEKEKIVFSTYRNINIKSNNKNFIMLVVDCVDSQMFKETINNSEFKNVFDDFTYYPDTMSTYSFTRESIPYIISGLWNENKTSYKEYYNNAFNSSMLLNKLNEMNYDINIYEQEFAWTEEKNSFISNLETFHGDINIPYYLENMRKYIKFKYYPYQLKQHSEIQTMDFNLSQYNGKIPAFSWSNPLFDHIWKNKATTLIDKNYFSFIHIEGAHPPYTYDKDFNYVGKEATYEMKLGATLRVINDFINKLKEDGVYDNSVIMILSDHGFNYGDYKGRQNPILYIKGIKEHHEMETSDIPVSFEDLNNAYMQLLNGDKSSDLFKNIDPNRKRRLLLYEFTKEDHMVEYEQTGKAWDEDTLIPTGREFNR